MRNKYVLDALLESGAGVGGKLKVFPEVLDIDGLFASIKRWMESLLKNRNC